METLGKSTHAKAGATTEAIFLMVFARRGSRIS